MAGKAEEKNRLRIQLTAEEILLKYQERFGEGTKVSVRCIRRLGRMRIELSFDTERFNPFEDGEDESSYVSETVNSNDDSEDMGFAISPTKVREAVYETILSIDGLAAAATDNASPFDFIKDPSAMPDEKAEIVEMSRLIKQAIAKLPQKERTVVEYRFYRNMQAKDIATMVGLSPSRITRIIQFSLNQIREYLKSKGRNDY